MCGIYGITENNRELIAQYIDVCRHRGPNGSNIWNNEFVTLGHNLLAITDDPSASQQPWITPAGNVLIYNGECFNYYELLKEYSNEFAPRTSCDTELIAWGLDRYGYEFIKKIDSMHGIAYYDIKQNHIWLSRGYSGIKPLYYAEIDRGLIFGSEIKGLLEHVPNSRRVDPLALSCMSLTGINVMRNTFFSNIKKVMPAETLIYDVNNKRFIRSYKDHIAPTSNNVLDPQEFRDAVKKTVHMTSLGKKEIGIFLSGGLDSSIVALEMKNLFGKVKTFTNRVEPKVVVGFEDMNNDAVNAGRLARQFNFDHQEVIVNPDTVIEHWDDAIYYMEQPVYNQSQVMYYYTNKIMSRNGIVVTMAGDMGDELLGGYTKYWKMKPGNSRNIILNSWEDVIELWLQRIKRPIELFGHSVDKNAIKSEMLKIYSESQLWNPEDPVGSYMALDCAAQVPNEFFSRNDTYGMAFSMEGRFPLATKYFTRYAMNIHSKHKLGEGKDQTKLPTKKSYEGILPDYIINKYKTGWTCPITQWQNKNLDLKNFLGKISKNSSCFDQMLNRTQQEKAQVPSLILKSWAQKYNMQL